MAWRREVIRFSEISAFGETLETDATCPARRFVEQFREELPVRVSEQEQGSQPQQEQRLPGLSVSRHGDAMPPPDVAPSRSRSGTAGRGEPTRKPSPGADILPEKTEKAPEEAANPGIGGGDS